MTRNNKKAARRRAERKAANAARSTTKAATDAEVLRRIGEAIAAAGVPCWLDEAAGTITQEFTFFPQDATSYRRDDGQAALRLYIRVTGGGQHVLLSAPSAWPVNSSNRNAVLETALVIQEKARRVRFGYDASEQVLGPHMEVNLHEGDSLGNQVLTGIREVFLAVLFYDGIIRSAMECRNPDPDPRPCLTDFEYKRLGKETFERLAAESSSNFKAVHGEVHSRLQSLGVLHGPKFVEAVVAHLKPVPQTEATVVIHEGGVLGLGCSIGPKFRKAALCQFDDAVNDVLGIKPGRDHHQATEFGTSMLVAENTEPVNREISDA